MTSAERRQLRLVAIRQDLMRVARDEGLPEGVGPQRHIYAERGRHGTAKAQAAVGGWDYPDDANQRPRLSWDEAMRAYGLTPHSETRTVSDRELTEDLRRVALLTGQGPDTLPPVEVYKEHGSWSWMTVLRRFGGEAQSWYRVAEYTKLRPARKTRRGSVTPARLTEDYQDLADLQGAEPGDTGPTRRQFDRYVSYSASCAAYHFGTWAEFVEAAGYDPHENPCERGAA